MNDNGGGRGLLFVWGQYAKNTWVIVEERCCSRDSLCIPISPFSSVFFHSNFWEARKIWRRGWWEVVWEAIIPSLFILFLFVSVLFVLRIVLFNYIGVHC